MTLMTKSEILNGGLHDAVLRSEETGCDLPPNGGSGSGGNTADYRYMPSRGAVGDSVTDVQNGCSQRPVVSFYRTVDRLLNRQGGAVCPAQSFHWIGGSRRVSD